NSMQHLDSLEDQLWGRRQSRETVAALERAAAAHRETIGLHPDDARAHLNLARVLEVQGKLEEALAEYRTANRLDVGHKLGANERFRWISVSGPNLPRRWVRAKRYLQLDEKIAQFESRLGRVLKAQGRLDESIAAYRDAARLRPGDA